MLTNPTIETLKSLKLHGMVEALEEQQQIPTVQALSFEERIALIVDRERLHRDNQRRTRLLRGAHLKVAEASIEDINYKAARGLDKRQIATPDLLEILDDRVNTGSTLIASQLPVDTWHAYLGEPTLADAILDRVVHHSHRMELKIPGESMRKLRTQADA
jgi:DNA replication protein DnaC